MNYISLLMMVFILSGCQSSQPDATNDAVQYDAEIRWTSYGIPHVKASTWRNLGYGYAYATAQDAVCVIAREVMVVSGEQTKHLGPDEGRLQSDIFHNAFVNQEVLQHMLAGQNQTSQEFSQGYVKGYNRYLRDHVDQLPDSCADKGWVRPITEVDVRRMTVGAQIRYGLGQFKQGIVNAQPPGTRTEFPSSIFSPLSGIGSNGVALGREVTESGRGMLLGNPHYPWRGASRFHLIHTTIPGTVDVMGVSLMTTTRILMGFNIDVAWTHTVSSAMRANVFELELNPDNPMQYLFEDTYRDIELLTVDVEQIGPNGQLGRKSHNIFLTHLGPILVSKQFPWNNQQAYAIRDANLYNNRHDETYDALHLAKNIDDVEAAISLQGVAFTNTIATDRHGTAFYADISVTPNLDASQLDACRVQLPGVPAYFVVMNGTQQSCDWKHDARARIPNVMPADDMPRLRRTDYVANANDSYWLSNPAEPLLGFSPTIGKVRSTRSLRTRAGLSFINELVSNGPVKPEQLQDMLFSHRNYAAELLLDDVLKVCTAAENSIVDVCKVLNAWDRTMQLDSRGSQVWTEFWKLAMRIENVYTFPFDVNDPANTPRGIAVENKSVREGIVRALQGAEEILTEAEIGLDQPLREIQYTTLNGEAIPIPGGNGRVGMYSIAGAPLRKGLGYTPINGGNSFIQVTSWDKNGNLDARGVLTYSQSQEPDSAHNADLTQLYSNGDWLKLPFTDAQINDDPNLRVLHLSE